jgi:protein involved in polysaccharide export with SLBB domain
MATPSASVLRDKMKEPMLSRLLAACLMLLLCCFAAAQDRALRPADVIKVICEEEPSIGAEYKLDRLGAAQINLLGSINLAGFTEPEAAALIKREIESRGILPRATITVRVQPSKDSPILYAGAVKRGGEVKPRVGLRLSEVVSLAEPTGAADMTRIKITSRLGQILLVDFTTAGPKQNPELRPGDHVFFPLVERALEVYILGAVAKPGSLPHRKGLTAKEALAESGGVLPGANASRAKVIKVNGEEWPLDLSEEGRDVQVEPGDTIAVPTVDRQRFVSVIGAVVRPGVVELEFGMNAARAVEAAGGFLPDADPQAVRVKRLRPDGERITANTPLLAFDTVEVPYTKSKSSAILQAALRVLSFISVFGR